jgi:hypothetical protein
MVKAKDFVQQLKTFKEGKIPAALIRDVKAQIEARSLDINRCRNVSQALYLFMKWINAIVSCLPKFQLKEQLQSRVNYWRQVVENISKSN